MNSLKLMSGNASQMLLVQKDLIYNRCKFLSSPQCSSEKGYNHDAFYVVYLQSNTGPFFPFGSEAMQHSGM